MLLDRARARKERALRKILAKEKYFLNAKVQRRKERIEQTIDKELHFLRAQKMKDFSFFRFREKWRVLGGISTFGLSNRVPFALFAS